MKRGSIVQLALVLSFVLTASAFADPPPEDVLRPEPSPSGYFFLQPHLGLNFSFLNSDRIRPLMPGLNESANLVVESGSSLGLLLGLDIGYAWNEHLATRIGFDYDVRHFGNHGSTINVCTITDDLGNVVEVRNEPVNMEYYVTGNYFSISLMEDFRWNSFYATLGIATAFSLSGTYYESDLLTDTATPCLYLFDGPDSTRQIGGELFGAPLFEQRPSLKIGVGYIKELSETTDLVIQVNYDHPLANLFLGAETIALQNEEFDGSRAITGTVDPNARFGTLQASVGIRFNLFDL